MADWDASTIASVTALVVSVFAMIIAMAQTVQQYLITGQLIRICDSVVYGPMPGQGRRVWQLAQFRFRVLYSIPQICLRADVWPTNSGMKSYAIGKYPLPEIAKTEKTVQGHQWASEITKFLTKLAPWRSKPIIQQGERDDLNATAVDDVEVVTASKQPQHNIFSFWRWKGLRHLLLHGRVTRKSYASSSRSTSESTASEKATLDKSRVGEASWVSFCRAIEMPCGSSVWLDHVQYDADRCPSDLVSAPMQVSMRDVIIMGLMAGMDITDASFNGQSVSMQGAVGTITSSKHAVLGPILHFTQRMADNRPTYVFGRYFGLSRGYVDKDWVWRTLDVCCVAGHMFNSPARRTVRRLDDRWIRDMDRERSLLRGKKSGPSDGPSQHDDKNQASGSNAWTRDLIIIPETPSRKQGRDPFTRAGNQEKDAQGQPVVRIGRSTPEMLPQDGAWTIEILLIPSKTPVNASAARQHDVGSDSAQEAKSPSIGKDDHVPVEEQPPVIIQADAAPNNIPLPQKPSRQATVEDYVDQEDEMTRKGSIPEFKNPPESKETASEVPTVEKTRAFNSTPLPVDQQTDEKERVIPVEATGSTPNREGNPDHINENIDKTLLERIHIAKQLQAKRAERLNQNRRDDAIVDDLINRGAIQPPNDQASEQPVMLLITDYAHNEKRASSPERAESDNDTEHDEEKTLTKEEQEARERTFIRDQERKEREMIRDERNRMRNQANSLQLVDMYWISQMDVRCGFWATPWRVGEHLPTAQALTGCVTVVLEALLGFLGSEYLMYTSHNFYETASWMCRSHSGSGEPSYNRSYPAYAHNARGGVIPSGNYMGCRIPLFPSRIIPILELAYSYDWQVTADLRDRSEIEAQNVELMRIDGWLSYVGRLEEISDGPHRLLRQTPALVHIFMQEFEIDFFNIDLSAKEGGLQDIQSLAANVMDFLTDEELTEAEQLYFLVAVLRSAKVGQCILAGSDTSPLQEILRRDIQVHLV